MRANGKTGRSAPTVTISLETMRPLLDEGRYLARCVEATCEWSRRWRKWVAILKMDPLDYAGQPYIGHLCKFFNLGQDPKRPHAGAGSQFRKLWIEVNGAQPTNAETGLEMFVGHVFEIEVSTVKTDREQKPIAPALQYSVIRSLAGSTTLQPSNPATLQPTNPFAQVQPSNPLTLQPLNKPSNPDNPLTQSLSQRSRSLGRSQPTENYPEHGAEPNSAPLVQSTPTRHCYVHGAATEWWFRQGDAVCGRCHPNPLGVN